MEMILPSTQNAVVISMQITLLILYKVTFTLLTLLKFIYATINVCHTNEKVKCEVRYVLDSLQYTYIKLTSAPCFRRNKTAFCRLLDTA